MGIECPKCGGDHVQAIKIILESGTTRSVGSFTGVGTSIGSGRGSMVVGSSSSFSQTNLANSLSAPPKGKFGPVIATGFFLVVSALTALAYLSSNAHDRGFGYFWLLLAGVSGLGMRSLYQRYKTTSRNYREQYPAWKSLYDGGFFCHRCGNKYLV